MFELSFSISTAFWASSSRIDLLLVDFFTLGDRLEYYLQSINSLQLYIKRHDFHIVMLLASPKII